MVCSNIRQANEARPPFLRGSFFLPKKISAHAPSSEYCLANTFTSLRISISRCQTILGIINEPKKSSNTLTKHLKIYLEYDFILRIFVILKHKL